MHADTVRRFIDGLREGFEESDADHAAKVREAAHLEVLEALYLGLLEGNAERVAAQLTPDAVLEVMGSCTPLAGRWEGRDAVLAGAGTNYARLADQRPELEFVVAQGDRVVVAARETGTFLPTGEPYEFPWVHLFRFRDGLIADLRCLHAPDRCLSRWAAAQPGD